MSFRQWKKVVFVFPAVVMGLLALYLAGATSLTCHRVENNLVDNVADNSQIDCTLNTYRWLGLVKKETSVNHLLMARLETYNCSTTDAEGRTRTKTCETLVLDAAEGVIRTDLSTKLVPNIQTFIFSPNETNFNVSTSRWLFSSVLVLFMLLWVRFGQIFAGQVKKEGK